MDSAQSSNQPRLLRSRGYEDKLGSQQTGRLASLALLFLQQLQHGGEPFTSSSERAIRWRRGRYQ